MSANQPDFVGLENDFYVDGNAWGRGSGESGRLSERRIGLADESGEERSGVLC
mgnify:CR=1 FL=1